MKACVFTGPSLAGAQAPDIPGFVYLPPARQGDVHRAAQSRPVAIGIIDGYFERVPSVWHKEVLWAMSRGIHVFGAASMGALRAAELDVYGMTGVGTVYEAFRDGALEDDDEVAIVHGPDTAGDGIASFMPLSEAMVNIRATLAAALHDGIIDEDLAALLALHAKACPFRERSYARALALAGEAGADRGRLRAFAAWVPGNAVDQKRLDALAMIERMRVHLEANPAPLAANFTFEYPVKWPALVEGHGARRDHEGATVGFEPLTSQLLEELRLEPDSYHRVWPRCLVRAAANGEARGVPSAVSAGQRAAAERDLIERLALASNAARDDWARDNEIDARRVPALLDEHARVLSLERELGALATSFVVDELRLCGAYVRLAARARAKRLVLVEWGLEVPALGQVGIDAPALVAWYFEQRLGRGAPPNLGRFARDLGFTQPGGLIHALLREYCYLRHAGVVDAAPAVQ